MEVLARWCRRRVGPSFGAEEAAGEEELADLMRLELCVVSDHFGMGQDAGTMEAVSDGMDADEKAKHLAASVTGKGTFGWPAVAEEPTLPREPGRLQKAYPLDLPMGVGGPHDVRPREVTRAEHAQHLLRLQSGRCVAGARQHRLVWALTNSVLLEEAGGRGFAVH